MRELRSRQKSSDAVLLMLIERGACIAVNDVS
jgi:hypothetical protein